MIKTALRLKIDTALFGLSNGKWLLGLERFPFDKTLITAAAPEIPQALINENELIFGSSSQSGDPIKNDPSDSTRR